jgi:hypothetical protein
MDRAAAKNRRTLSLSPNPCKIGMGKLYWHKTIILMCERDDGISKQKNERNYMKTITNKTSKTNKVALAGHASKQQNHPNQTTTIKGNVMGTSAIYKLFDGTEIEEKSSTYGLDGMVAEIEFSAEIKYGLGVARLVEVSHETWKFS